MISSIRIHSFQCHDRLKVDLSGVTSIVGPSDVGKSALIRSLKWLATNSPQGDEFIQDGVDGCSVTIGIDGQTIRRRKGKGINEYLLNDRSFKAFGNNVPDPIKDILKIDQLNFQNQHDSPFWFCETAGQVSRNLNAIIDLELIDKCLSSVNKKVNRNRTEVEIVEGRVKELIKKKNKLKWVKEASKEFKNIEEIDEKRQEIELKYAKLYNVLVDIADRKEEEVAARGQLKDLKKVIGLGEQCKEISKEIYELNWISEEIARLKKIKKPDISDMEGLVERYKIICTRTKDLTALIRLIQLTKKTIIDPDTHDIDGMFELHAKNRLKIKSLADFIYIIKTQKDRIKEWIREIKKTEKELQEKTEGMCPLCGKMMS